MKNVKTSDPDLREVQKIICEAMTLQKNVDAAHLLIDDKTSQANAETRFAVYADAWFLRLEESLMDDFSVLGQKLGSDIFSELLRSYLQSYPSKSFTIARTGDSLPEFMESKGSADWQVELARLELDLCRSKTAANSIPFDVKELQSMDEAQAESLRLFLQPSAFLHRLNFNTLDVLGGADPGVSEGANALVCREGWNSISMKIESEEFEFLEMLQSGASFGEIADQFPETDWVSWIVKWSKLGVIGPLQPGS